VDFSDSGGGGVELSLVGSAIVIVDGVPSTFDLEEVEIENSSERSSVGFPRSHEVGKLDSHRFLEMKISAPASAVSAKNLRRLS
jgi:hypothetical protein